MRINKIKFSPSQTNERGLQEIKLDRLETVVALVGKNGSGKTRILNLIENEISSIITIKNILQGNITNLPHNIKQLLKKLEPYKDLAIKTFEMQEITVLRQKNPSDSDLKNEQQLIRSEIIRIENDLRPKGPIVIISDNPLTVPRSEPPSRTLKVLIDEIQPLVSKLKTDFIKRINYDQIKQLTDVITDNEDEANSFEQLVENVSEQLEYNELGSIYKSSLRFLKKLPHQLVSDWIDCLGDINKFNKRQSYKRFESLKEIFEKIFGKELDWEIKNVNRNITDNGVESLQVGIWKINGREFNYLQFSDGEKSLFAYVLMFFLMSQNKDIRLKDSILIIDEPELHLHPDAEIDLINGIRTIINENGQLFIATHSLNILSHLNYEEVFMVKDGLIKHPSNTIQREALSELMKIEERVLKLTEFLNSISEWAYVQFMIECFTNPEVIEVAKKNDPQVMSLKDIVNNTEGIKKSLLLDFGAGKGRLYEQVMQDENFRKKIDYSALEPNTEFHTTLKTKGVKTIYESYDKIPNHKFDFVVLCNVLHEIDITEWIPTLNKIIDSLKDNGSLIIIEAKHLKKGEQIDYSGYLLLDESELKILFGLKENPSTLTRKDISDNITCVLISKNKLKPLTNNNLLNTIQALEENTLNKIQSIRESKNDDISHNKKGRTTAFLSQLHINSRLTLKRLQQISQK
ncbi:MAG: AAA family ATPase [Bacteroidota bacterium]